MSTLMQKHKFCVMCPGTLFIGTAPVPPELEKSWVNISRPGCTEMHYVTHISYRMQKHKFVVTFPDALVMETALGPSEH
jgi:hypothetical protein